MAFVSYGFVLVRVQVRVRVPPPNYLVLRTPPDSLGASRAAAPELLGTPPDLLGALRAEASELFRTSLGFSGAPRAAASELLITQDSTGFTWGFLCYSSRIIKDSNEFTRGSLF